MSPCRLTSIDDEGILQKSFIYPLVKGDFVTQLTANADANALVSRSRNVHGLVKDDAYHGVAFECAMVPLAEEFFLKIFVVRTKLSFGHVLNYPSVS
jgi:hypothetical protein